MITRCWLEWEPWVVAHRYVDIAVQLFGARLASSRIFLRSTRCGPSLHGCDACQLQSNREPPFENPVMSTAI